MHGHELLEGIAATVLVTSGAVLMPKAWLARRRLEALPDRTARLSAEALLLGALAVVTLLAMVALVASVPAGPHH